LQAQWVEIETQRSVCRFHRIELIGRKRIREDGDSANGRQHLLEQPEPFRQQIQVLEE
jgi:hypothetical protein